MAAWLKFWLRCFWVMSIDDSIRVTNGMQFEHYK